jgi:GNAT superfamily N-acetyltransferase
MIFCPRMPSREPGSYRECKTKGVAVVTYRRFQPHDAEHCRRLNLACVADFTGVAAEAYERMREKIRAAPYQQDMSKVFCIVGVENDEVIGMGALDGNKIKRMYVNRRCRHQGIGRKIHELLESEARNRGVKQLELVSSLNAVGFYTKLGYKSVTEMRHHFEGAEVVNVIMTKQIRH